MNTTFVMHGGLDWSAVLVFIIIIIFLISMPTQGVITEFGEFLYEAGACAGLWGLDMVSFNDAYLNKIIAHPHF